MVLFAYASCMLGWTGIPALAQKSLTKRDLDCTLSHALRLLMAGLCALGAILAWLMIPDVATCLLFSFACACISALLACDLRHHVLPTELVAIFLGLGVAFRCAAGSIVETTLVVIPVACIAATLLVCNALRVRQGKSEIVGSGDLRMLVPLVLFCGAKGLMSGLFAAACVMCVSALFVLVSKNGEENATVALAPALAAWFLAGTISPFA